jgi:crotonobetainyl-CoA:carnitine CoA-transferase CaiB-like acyl-CoA transferase
MSLLSAERVLALDGAADGPLARLLESFGALIVPSSLVALDEAQIKGADLLVECLGASSLAARGWTLDRLAAVAPRLIHVSVTPFGSDGPRSAWRGSELVASAMGGVLGLTGPVGRPPVKEADHACGFHAQMVAAAGAMAALHERSASGRGQHVDVSVQQVAFSRQFNSILSWQFDRRKIARLGQGDSLNYGLATVRCIWRLKDGWCFHSLMTGRFGAPANQALSDWIDESQLPNPLRGVEWLKYDRSRLDADVRRRWEQAIAAFFATRSKQDIDQEGRRRGINAAVVAEPADVLDNPQLRVREFWRTDAAGRREPSRFVSIAARADVVAGEPEARDSPACRGPLAGVRVLDFSWALVGSITTKTLGDLGAEVIKVESQTRPCLTRLDVQVKASRHGNFDDKPWFAHLNTSKKSLALDMKKPESREILEPLIRWADVVVENFSPGTMAKLGLDYPALCRGNPRIIMVSGSVYGQSGPRAQEWGVDGTGGALSGRTFLTGWPDSGPVIPGAVPYGDVIVPYVMAAAVPAALDYRRRHGAGLHVDASMLEICVQQMRRELLAAQDGGPAPQREGNADAAIFHQGVYAVQGAEHYIAIECADANDWQELGRCAGWSAAEIEAGASSVERREALLHAWCKAQQGEELTDRLQAHRIGAGMVQDIEAMMEHDPQLKWRAALLILPHPLLGEFGHLRTPLNLSRSESRPFRAPCMGEHSIEVARQIAGLGEQRVKELEALGVFM